MGARVHSWPTEMILLKTVSTHAMIHLLLATVLLMPMLIYSHEHHGSGKNSAIPLTELARGAKLVMENHSGDVTVRTAREAATEKLATVPVTTTVGGNKRVKNNKKGNNPNNQMQRAGAAGSRKSSLKQSSLPIGKDVLMVQPRHFLKPKNAEHQHRSGKRSGARARTTQNAPSCRYAKSSWTDCDAKTNMRTRTLSLKRGESQCPPTRTIQKKCKKACRYEKGPWSECIAGQMTREEKLKASEDDTQHSCDLVHINNKKCTPGAIEKKTATSVRSSKVRKHKEKGTRQTPTPA
ncbi:uncharacterized protein [Drosophila virilis]|uniref:Uncharacterized protein, isoform B n=1 Tax=Drosophila virilis TaxID=7244 RepID=B4MGR2_DROVI|nr:uncharacterized protein LOC6636843 isoform X2 [Drosophila virilis]EDW57128.2 uncharacterized protein Dvir_GJ16095, isoform B [Drosophila virilis]